MLIKTIENKDTELLVMAPIHVTNIHYIQCLGSMCNDYTMELWKVAKVAYYIVHSYTA